MELNISELDLKGFILYVKETYITFKKIGIFVCILLTILTYLSTLSYLNIAVTFQYALFLELSMLIIFMIYDTRGGGYSL